MKDILIIVIIAAIVAIVMIVKAAYGIIKSLNNEVNKKYTNRDI